MEPESQAETLAYIRERMLFVPRLLGEIARHRPEIAERFADYYNEGKQDRALPRKTKELMFMAIGVAYRSPRCLIHVIPAIEGGATDGEIFETVTVGTLGAGFVPGGPGIPYAFEYALKALDVAAKYRKGERWEYIEPAKFTT